MYSELSLATTMTPVSCYMTSFNFGAEKARDAGCTYRCHLSNVMPNGIFHDSMGWGWGEDSSFF